MDKEYADIYNGVCFIADNALAHGMRTMTFDLFILQIFCLLKSMNQQEQNEEFSFNIESKVIRV